MCIPPVLVWVTGNGRFRVRYRSSHRPLLLNMEQCTVWRGGSRDTGRTNSVVVIHTARGVEHSVLTAHVPLLPPHLLAESQRAQRLGAYRRVPSTAWPRCVMCSARAGEDGGVGAALPLPGMLTVLPPQEETFARGSPAFFLQLETSDTYFTLLPHRKQDQG